MSTGEEAESGKRAAAAFRRVDWKTLLPQLVRGAWHYLRVLGLAEDDDHRPSTIEVKELVTTTVDRCLTGKRQWTLGPDATEAELVAFLSKTMLSIALNCCTSAANLRAAGSDALDALLDEGPSPSRRFAEQALLERVEQAFEGDDEALAVVEAFADSSSTKCEEIAGALRWTVEHLYVVQRRMRRRLASKRITLNDDREAGPPSASPHGREHDTPQPTGVRRRAPVERDPGARVAGRRSG